MSGVHAPDEVALHLAVAHTVPGRNHGGITVFVRELRHPVVAIVVLDRGVFAVPLFQDGDHELRLIRVVAVSVGFLREPVSELRMLVLTRIVEVAREAVRGSSDVGGTLNVRFAAERVHAAAGDADVAKQQLNHSHRAAVLGTKGVLRFAERVEDRADAFTLAGGGVNLIDLLEDFFIDTGNGRNLVERVAGIVALHDLEHAVRILQRHVLLRLMDGRVLELRDTGLRHPVHRALRIPLAVRGGLVGPGLVVILVGLGVVAREVAGFRIELEVRVDQARGVRVVLDVLILPEVVGEDVVHHAAEEGDVGTRADAGEEVSLSGGTGVAGINHDPGAALTLSAFDVAGGKRVGLNAVRADRHDDVGVFDVAPVGGHGAAAKGRGKASRGGGVAGAGLVIDLNGAKRTAELLHEPGFFRLQLGSADGGHAVVAVHEDAVFVFNEVFVTGLLHVTGDFVKGVFPGDVFPLVGAGAANLRLQEAGLVMLHLAVRRNDVAEVEHGRALRAETAFIHRMIRIAFKVHEFAVANRADHTAAASAVAADVREFLG